MIFCECGAVGPPHRDGCEHADLPLQRFGEGAPEPTGMTINMGGVDFTEQPEPSRHRVRVTWGKGPEDEWDQVLEMSRSDLHVFVGILSRNDVWDFRVEQVASASELIDSLLTEHHDG